MMVLYAERLWGLGGCSLGASVPGLADRRRGWGRCGLRDAVAWEPVDTASRSPLGDRRRDRRRLLSLPLPIG